MNFTAKVNGPPPATQGQKIVFRDCDTDAVTQEWPAALITESSDPWINAAFVPPDIIRVGVNPSGLPVGTHSGSVTVSIPEEDTCEVGAVFSIAIQLTIEATVAKFKFNSPSVPPPSGSEVTSFQLTAPISGTHPFTIGLGFKKGDVPAYAGLALSTSQVIVMSRWSDNSVKHAIASGRAALVENVPTVINVLTAPSENTGINLTSADIQTATPSASVQCGSIGTVNLSSLLATPFRTWISGPEMVECHYRATVGSDTNLRVWFHVRLYLGGRVWIRAIVENGYVNITPVDKSYVPTVSIGGVTIYNNGGAALPHYKHTRWVAEAWIGTDPQVTPKHETTYLNATKLVPNYWKRSPSATALNNLYQTYAPNQNGGWTPGMSDTGFQTQIGILPNWDALYCTSGDARAWRSVIANSKALNSYPIVRTDSVTHAPMRPSDRPNWTIEGDGGGGGTAIGTVAGLIWDVAHHGSGGYLAYLITGDYFHLETMEHQSSLCYLMVGSSHGAGTSRALRGQTRAVAWCYRTIGQLAGIGPADTITSDYRTLLAYQGTYWKTFVDTPGINLLGYIYSGEIGGYGPGGVAPWQQHFWMQSFGYVSDLEPLTSMTTWNAVRDWIYRGVVGILGTSPGGYCFNSASQYFIVAMPADNPDATTWYDSWSQVYLATFAANPACTNTLGGASGGAPSSAFEGYWGNLLPAIAYAVDHAANGAASSWSRLTGATNWSTVENSGFHDVAIWGIVPRVTVAVSSTTPSIEIDTPANNATVSGTINVAGWALDNINTIETAIQKVEVFMDGNLVANATYGDVRTDVCNQYPNRIGCPNVGFHYSLNTTGFSNGNHTLMVVATDTDATPKTASQARTINIQNGGGGGATALSTLAASMAVGSWAELTTLNMGSIFFQPGSSQSIMDYAANAAWDPVAKKFLYTGSDHIDGNLSYGVRFVIYDEATNSWTQQPNPPFYSAGNTDHGYYHHALDPATGTMYRRAGKQGFQFYKYVVSTGTWTALPVNNQGNYDGACCEGASWFPGLGFIYAQGGENGGGQVYRFNTTTNIWSKLASNLAPLTYGAFMVGTYSPLRNAFMFGYDFYWYKVDSAGTVTRMANAPIQLGGSNYLPIVVADPVTGKFIALSAANRDLWSYEVNTDSWAAVSSTNKPNLGFWNIAGAPISNYGVLMYVAFSGTTGKVWLYKHA